jgi:hypothetical protein
MADRVLRELDSIRKLSLNMGGWLILAAIAWFGLGRHRTEPVSVSNSR